MSKTTFNNTSFNKGKEIEKRFHGSVNARLITKRNLSRDIYYYDKLEIGKTIIKQNNPSLSDDDAIKKAKEELSRSKNAFGDDNLYAELTTERYGADIEKKEHPQLTYKEAYQIAEQHIKENKNYYRR